MHRVTGQKNAQGIASFLTACELRRSEQKGSRRSLTFCTTQILTRIVGLHRDDLTSRPGRTTRARAPCTAREEGAEGDLAGSADGAHEPDVFSEDGGGAHGILFIG